MLGWLSWLRVQLDLRPAPTVVERIIVAPEGPPDAPPPAQTPTLLYSRGDGHAPVVQLYQGDVRDVVPLVPLESVAAIISDPPYALYRYIRELYEKQHLEPREDMGWQREVWYWMCEWWFPLRGLLRPDGAMWLFCDLNYLGMYLRLATMIGYPMRQLWALSDFEFLIYCSPTRLPVDIARRIHAAGQLNTYGSKKSVEWMRVLVDASPEGLIVDPFCGYGATVVAAAQAGRPAIGVELDETVAQAACVSLREMPAAF